MFGPYQSLSKWLCDNTIINTNRVKTCRGLPKVKIKQDNKNSRVNKTIHFSLFTRLCFNNANQKYLWNVFYYLQFSELIEKCKSTRMYGLQITDDGAV